MAHQTLVGNLYRPRIKATGPRVFLHNLEMPVSQPAACHLVPTASPMALLGPPNEKGWRPTTRWEGVVAHMVNLKSEDGPWESSQDPMLQNFYVGLVKV
ncbi:hypothetical protein G6514_008867 [Epicoccum nigrum]|nr:hypothetical protein G6514_008867 [Epicoccum nigrum]